MCMYKRYLKEIVGENLTSIIIATILTITLGASYNCFEIRLHETGCNKEFIRQEETFGSKIALKESSQHPRILACVLIKMSV